MGDEQPKKPRRKPTPKPLRERCDLLDAQLPVVVPTLLKMLAAYNRRDESVGDAGSEVVLREEMDAVMRLERIAADVLAFRELYETHLGRDLAVAILDALTPAFADPALKEQDRMRRVIEEVTSRGIIVTEEVLREFEFFGRAIQDTGAGGPMEALKTALAASLGAGSHGTLGAHRRHARPVSGSGPASPDFFGVRIKEPDVMRYLGEVLGWDRDDVDALVELARAASGRSSARAAAMAETAAAMIRKENESHEITEEDGSETSD